MNIKVGTSVYMAQEVVSEEHYDEKADCLSFGMMIYVVMSERLDSYENFKGGFGIEMMVANDEKYSPKIDNISYLE